MEKECKWLICYQFSPEYGVPDCYRISWLLVKVFCTIHALKCFMAVSYHMLSELFFIQTVNIKIPVSLDIGDENSVKIAPYGFGCPYWYNSRDNEMPETFVYLNILTDNEFKPWLIRPITCRDFKHRGRVRLSKTPMRGQTPMPVISISIYSLWSKVLLKQIWQGQDSLSTDTSKKYVYL